MFSDRFSSALLSYQASAQHLAEALRIVCMQPVPRVRQDVQLETAGGLRLGPLQPFPVLCRPPASHLQQMIDTGSSCASDDIKSPKPLFQTVPGNSCSGFSWSTTGFQSGLKVEISPVGSGCPDEIEDCPFRQVLYQVPVLAVLVGLVQLLGALGAEGPVVGAVPRREVAAHPQPEAGAEATGLQMLVQPVPDGNATRDTTKSTSSVLLHGSGV